jgi:hypothetical protein
MNRFFVTCCTLLAATSLAHAEGRGTIEGTVTDESGDVITSNLRVHVEITCGDVHRTARVDGSGHFSASGLPEGRCVIAATGNGYAAQNLAVVVHADAIATVLVRMAKPMVYEPAKLEQRMPATPIPAPAVAPAPPPPPMKAPPVKHVAHNAPADQPVAGAGARPVAIPPANLAMGRAQLAGDQKVADRRIAGRDIGARLDKKQKERWRAKNDEGEAWAEVEQWAPVRVFPVPQYTKGYDGPRTDFRETIYWNADVQTNADGNAEVSFVTNDAVTAFRVTAEGFSANGTPGLGTLAIKSKLPVSIESHLPVEVTSGDRMRLPITIVNDGDEAIDAEVAATFGAAFKLTQDPSGKLHLAAGEHRALFFPLDVVATEGNAELDVTVTARGLKDELKKTVRVVPRGFPFEGSAAGTAKPGELAHHVIDLQGALPGSVHATVTMYPSPVAAMTQGMEAMIREPGGCFEQTSSSNYPNVMVLAYLASNDAAEPALVQRAQGKLDKGYKLLTGYETSEKGYEWFGKTPGHEALTAYGLMEFADMAKVYEVDAKMVERTADWLMKRRDGNGGFKRSTEALDSFGRASEQTTNAYIVWALAEAKRTHGLDKELAATKELGASTKDPYLLALVANTELLVAPTAGETKAMVERLVAMQDKTGAFLGAKQSITMSGGESLDIETTAIATLALIKASPNNERESNIRSAVDWLNAHKNGYGGWSNTQATILGLKALAAYSDHARQMMSGGAATLIVNGKELKTIEFEKGRREALVWDDFAAALVPGKNTIELKLAGQSALPYSIAIGYRSANPASSPRAKVAVATEIAQAQAKMGAGVTIRAHVENKTKDGLPMTIARVGIPGGTVFQTWQLKELRDKGAIDFYETRPREVILYWRALPPSAKKDVKLDLLAAVPGTYEAPASSAYLYYTAEDKSWTAGEKIAIDK